MKRAAIQHGQNAAARIWNDSFIDLPENERDPENLLNKIYKYRIDTYSGHSNRYTRENAISLEMLYYEGE